MADLVFIFHVARYIGTDGALDFDKPVRTIAAHPIAAAERVMQTRLYLVGDPQNLYAEVSYTSLDGEEERVLLYHGFADQSQARL
ncbi:MAG: hypothetical protein P0Y65_20385 [Candidatus Devosia phytovorans]|uniref:Uncharacterized protein n=1 Tax=Candidatus Devosia phytovorans TaxID=3121372 RepID=A0AAJ5VVX9_9HYPH|nr:hypothetical protein [Devosia sp.]WEK04502.1 MAG: hypothetical protein P0Y65_20385 [Devosia sp.]